MKTWQGIAKADQFHSFLPSSMSLFEFCNLSKILLSVTKDCYSLYHVHCTLYIMYRRITKIAHPSLPASIGWVALSLLFVVVRPAVVTFLPLCHFLFLQFPPHHPRHPSCPSQPSDPRIELSWTAKKICWMRFLFSLKISGIIDRIGII